MKPCGRHSSIGVCAYSHDRGHTVAQTPRTFRGNLLIYFCLMHLQQFIIYKRLIYTYYIDIFKCSLP